MKAQLDPRIESLTERIIGGAYVASNGFGHGFLESVYKKALVVEFGRQGVSGVEELPFKTSCQGQTVGTCFVDLVVEGAVIVDVNAVEALAAAHTGQVLNYLRASGLPVGLPLNFGRPRLEVRRVLV